MHYGEAILAKIRKLEKTMIRYLSYSNHSWFSLLFVRCHNKILAKNQQVKSKIKTELTITILTFAGNFLWQEWVHINHFIRGKFKNNIKQLKGKILESMTPGKFYLVKKFHQILYKKFFDLTKKRHIRHCDEPISKNK